MAKSAESVVHDIIKQVLSGTDDISGVNVMQKRQDNFEKHEIEESDIPALFESFNKMGERKAARIKAIAPLLDDVTSLLNFLVESSVTYPDTVRLKGKTLFISNQFSLSLEQTFKNIRCLLLEGSYSDAFALLRKFRDDFLLYLVILFDATDRNKTFTKTTSSGDLFADPDRALKDYLDEVFGHDDVCKERVAIDDWSSGKDTKKTIDYDKYLLYLRRDPDIGALLGGWGFEEKLRSTDRVLNGYTHSAGLSYFEKNVTCYFSDQKVEALNGQFQNELATILSFVLLSMTHINPWLLSVIPEEEESTSGAALRFTFDYRVWTFFEKYVGKSIWQYIRKRTVFDDFDCV